MPGTHHVEARVFKDVFPRYRTMKGYHVPRRRAGTATGCPVELAVEKELGFTGKPDIEAYGIEAFNAKCRENGPAARRRLRDHERAHGLLGRLRARLLDHGRRLRRAVWWALKTIFDKGLLVEDHRVSPYCPRCGTALSDHEVAQGYETVVDPSVYVRFPLTGPARWAAPGPTCWSGRRRRGRWCRTPPWP